MFTPPLQKCYAEIQYQNKYEQHNACCDQRFSVQSCCISHLNYDIGCQCTYTAENAFRHSCLVSCNHDNCHRFSDCTADSKNQCCDHSGFCCRDDKSENRAFVSSSKCHCPFIILFRDCSKRRLCKSDNSWQDAVRILFPFP